MKVRTVYVVLFQMDDSIPADVIGVYETVESANAAAEQKGCWVVVSEFRV